MRSTTFMMATYVASFVVALALVLGGVTPQAHAQQPLSPVLGGAQSDPEVTVSLLADKSAFTPGSTVHIGVKFKIKEHWHIYHKEPGETGRATTVDLNLPDGFTVGETIWQQPETFTDFGLTAYGYSKETIIIIPVTIPSDYQPGDEIEITSDITWLACEMNCVPGQTTLSIKLPVVASADQVSDTNTEAFGTNQAGDDPGGTVFDKDFQLEETADGFLGYLKVLLFAVIGGFILNFMPCVLPVISLKIIGFVNEAGESRSKIFRLGLAYGLGTVTTCLALGLMIIALQVGGYSVGWGFQFQQPFFLLGMATLVAVMSLGLFGVFLINVNSGKALGDLSNKKGLTGAFFTGVVATILATPCSAPFLGTAIGFAFAQPWWGILAIFAAIGLGLASPYVVLSMNPAWTKFIPKPGMWMEHFKQAMGFVLLFSAVWLLYILGQQVGSAGIVGALVFIVATCFGAWLIGNFASFDATKTRKVVIWILALAIAGTSFCYFAYEPVANPQILTSSTTAKAQDNGIEWQDFDLAFIDKELKAGKVVFLDFTADWCGTCKFNEANTLAAKEVGKKFTDNDVVAVKADWTSNDPVITKTLRQFGKSSVPLYVVMSPHRPNQPIVLPEILTEQMVIDAIDAALTK